jgi:hypothetical protein
MSRRSTTDLNSDNDILTSIESELLDNFNFESRNLYLPTTTTMQDSINYWKDNAERFPFLKNLAYNILSIPVSSAAAEREFSVSGWHSLGRKNRTTGVTFAAKVFLTCNKRPIKAPFFKSCLLSSLFFAVSFFSLEQRNIQMRKCLII